MAETSALALPSNIWTAWLLYEDTPDMPQNVYVRGDKRYELTNHLGNVLATNPEAGNTPATGAAYNAVADRRSWAARQTFLAE